MSNSSSTINRIGVIPLISMIVGVIGVIAPIMYSYYTSRSMLEVRLESSVSLLQSDPLLKDDLQITYKGKPITGLTRMDFLVLNNGTMPITKTDVTDAPAINFGDGAQVIAAKVTSTDPLNLEAEITTDTPNKIVRILPGLMNPTDYVRIAVYLHAVPHQPPAVLARIKGIKEIKYVDARPEQNPVLREVPWIVFPVGVISMLFGGLAIIGVREARIHSRIRRRLRNQPNFLGEINGEAEYRRLIANDFTFATSSERKNMYDSLNEYAKTPTPDSKERLIAVMEAIIQETGGAEVIAYLLTPIAILGVAYVAWQVW